MDPRDDGWCKVFILMSVGGLFDYLFGVHHDLMD
jgi:hypothetical protein